VGPESTLAGLSRDAIDLRPYGHTHLIGVLDSRGQPQADGVVSAGTVLLVRGPGDGIEQFASDHELSIEHRTDVEPVEYGLVGRDYGVAEVIVTPRSTYIGDEVFPGMVTDSGELVVLAVQRHGEDLGADEVVLKAGDSILLQGGWDALDQHTQDPNVLLVDSPDAVRRQTVPLGPKAVPALVVLGVMVVLLSTGVVPAVVAGLFAAIAMVLLRVVTLEQAHRAMSWSTLILVAGMIPLSTAITQSGAADLLAGGIVGTVGRGGPYVLLLVLFLVNAALGQLISNTATALILIPIAISVAAEMGISPMPLLMCVNVASAAALLTPVATPANIMVQGPGGYLFSDYAKLGLPVLLLYLLVAVFLVPVWWPW
jgi:di/tricarboxylate transporter